MMQRAILHNLNNGHLGMMSTTTLWSEVMMDLGGASYTEFKAALTELERKEQIVIVKGEDRVKAKITDAGKARLLES